MAISRSSIAVSLVSIRGSLAIRGPRSRLERPVGNYSQGMRQRTSLARVLISQPELLLLDEPFSNMDVSSAQQMISLLGKVSQ